MNVPVFDFPELLVCGALLLFAGYVAGGRDRLRAPFACMLALGAVIFPLLASAAPASIIPFTFSNGSTANADQVNSNFRVLNDAIRSGTAAVSQADFRAADGRAQITLKFGNGGAWISNGLGSLLVATANVPYGARVTRVEAGVFDTNPSADLEVCVGGQWASSVGSSPNLGCVRSAGSSGYQPLTIDSLGTIPQPGRIPEIFVTSTDTGGNAISWPSACCLTVVAARVTWEMP